MWTLRQHLSFEDGGRPIRPDHGDGDGDGMVMMMVATTMSTIVSGDFFNVVVYRYQ